MVTNRDERFPGLQHRQKLDNLAVPQHRRSHRQNPAIGLEPPLHLILHLLNQHLLTLQRPIHQQLLRSLRVRCDDRLEPETVAD